MRMVIAVVVLMLACSSRNDEELGRTATAAMKELDAADEAFPRQFTEVSGKLGADLLFGPSRAAETVETKLLPLVDDYLAVLDRAVAAADKYLATADDDTSKRNVEKIRKRGEGFKKARERFVELAQKARAGATAEELNKMMMTIGVMLTVGK
jgi:hypothetical protein